MPSTRPLPTVIGSTENALRALLTRTLSPMLVPSYPAWAVLNAASVADTSDNWRQTVGDNLKADLDEIEAVLAELRAVGLVNGEGTLTTNGNTVLTAARVAVRETTLRLVKGIDEVEQETARRVLDTIRRNAEELLSA